MDVREIQKSGRLYNIFPENFELQFYQVFRTIKELGCDYFYFLGVANTDSYRFCTHEHWIDYYYDEKFVLNDPLKRITEDSTFILLPWEQVTHLHGHEKITMSGRGSFGLFNGLSITRKFNNRKYIFALATECKEHAMARYFLLENIGKLEQFVCSCMRLFDQFLMLMAQPVVCVM